MSRPLAAALFLPLLAAFGVPHAQGNCGDIYTVMRGDTLYRIARHCRGSVAAIARASGLADSRAIEVGQRLVIRRAGSAAPDRDKDEPGRETSALSYRFAPGDTLYSLARWSRVSLRALIGANPGIDPHKIEIGDAVRLPAGAVPPDRARARERGRETSPPPPPPPRETRREAPPSPPPGDKPEDNEEEDEPEGM